MGYPLVERLLALDYPVTVYNRTPARAQALEAADAQLASTPQQAAENCQILLFFVSSAPAVEAILDPLPAEALTGRTVIVLSTTSSAESERLQARVVAAEGRYIEAPVMGGPSQVREGSVTMLVGANDSDWQAWQPFLEQFASQLYRVGPVGSASTLKLALNQFMAAEVSALATSVALVQSAGVPVETLMEILRQFPYYAKAFDSKLPLMLADDFSNPKFTIDMMGKDVRLMYEEAQAHGVYAATLRSILDLYVASSEAGHGEDDYSAIFREIAASS
jgi:3-hydroxyisobutyrate dehydrogenase-like beta-hydroxyacid dehydrogenase